MFVLRNREAAQFTRPAYQLMHAPCDMRHSFAGLHSILTCGMQRDAFGAQLTMLDNRPKDRVNILYWDGVGRPQQPVHDLLCLKQMLVRRQTAQWRKGS